MISYKTPYALSQVPPYSLHHDSNPCDLDGGGATGANVNRNPFDWQCLHQHQHQHHRQGLSCVCRKERRERLLMKGTLVREIAKIADHRHRSATDIAASQTL